MVRPQPFCDNTISAKTCFCKIKIDLCFQNVFDLIYCHVVFERQKSKKCILRGEQKVSQVGHNASDTARHTFCFAKFASISGMLNQPPQLWKAKFQNYDIEN